MHGEQPISYSSLRGMMLAAIVDTGLPVQVLGTDSSEVVQHLQPTNCAR